MWTRTMPTRRLVVPRPGCKPAPESILDHLGKHFAKWQLPDAVLFVEALPMTATGKVQKFTLRERARAL